MNNIGMRRQEQKDMLNVANLTSSDVQDIKEGAREAGAMNLLRLNNLIYKMKSRTTVVSQRNMKEYEFDRDEYKNTTKQVALTALNTGELYVDGSNSWFSFDVTVSNLPAGATSWDWGVGSAMNLFSTILITSENGVELHRIDDANRYLVQNNKYEKDDFWFQREGKAMGYGSTALAEDTVYSYTVPLDQLGGIFGVKNQLLPSVLLAGVKIELHTENPINAIKCVGTITEDATSLSYIISNPKFHLDTYLLADAIHKKILDISASNGLEIVYETVETDKQSTPATTINMTSKKTVSLARQAFAGNYGDVDTKGKVDQMQTQAFDLDQFNFRIGSTYYPLQPLQTTNAADESKFNDSYFNTLYAFEAFNNRKYVSATFDDFATGGFGIASTTLELDTHSVSSVPINNNRQLLYRARSSTTDANRTTIMYLKFVRVAKAYLNNLVVRD